VDGEEAVAVEAARPALSDAELTKLLALIKGATASS